MPALNTNAGYFPLYLAILLLLIHVGTVNGAEDSDDRQVRIYRNPEERREAGLGRELTDWLRVSGLFETERENIKYKYQTDNTSPITEEPGTVYTMQIGLDLQLSDWLDAQLVLESEYEVETHAQVDEAVLSAEFDSLGITLGRLNVPFGEYYSHFITDPILGISETRADTLIVDYSFFDSLELAAYLFENREKAAGDYSGNDWGVNLDFTSDQESIRLGLGYLSHLGSNSELITADIPDTEIQTASAWNMYALFGVSQFEVTTEYIKTNNKFLQVDNLPKHSTTYNFEFAYFLLNELQAALRYESSKEIVDQPNKQYGISITWRQGKYFLFSIEYLRGKYKSGTYFDESDNEITGHRLIAGQIALEF